MEEFIEGKYFDGELFVDMKKQSYKKMGFKRLGLMGLPGAIFSKKSRDAAAKVQDVAYLINTPSSFSCSGQESEPGRQHDGG